MYKIKNKQIEALVNPLGAELSSLKLHGQEMLWHGDERFWSGRAPILFPIVGALKDGCMNYNGTRYEMPRHGLARRSHFECTTESEKAVTLVLKADNDSLKQYPWNFELKVSMSLTDNGLRIQYDVVNNDSDKMLFTIGSHPAFALNASSDLEAFAVHVQQSEPLTRYQLTDDGLLATTPHPFNTDGNVIQLNQNLFDDDALVFRDISAKAVSLLHKGNTVLTVDTGDAPHLGIWSKPGAAFVCIEPWLGTSDFEDADGNFANKNDLRSLPPGQSFSHSIGVEFPPGA